MDHVRCDPHQVEALANHAARFHTELRDHIDAILAQLSHLEAAWPDRVGANVAAEISSTILVMRGQGVEPIEEWASRMARCVVPLFEYLQEGSRTSVASVGGSALACPPVRGSGPTGEVFSRRGQEFQVWSFAGVDPASIDWGADQDFPSKFGKENWKGHTPDDYRRLMREAPAMLAAARASGPDDVPESMGITRDGLFGSDAIKIEVGPSGRISVTNGRHRIMAAIEAGAAIPVIVTRY